MLYLGRTIILPYAIIYITAYNVSMQTEEYG